MVAPLMGGMAVTFPHCMLPNLHPLPLICLHPSPTTRREGRYEIRKVDHVEVHPEFKSSDTNQHNLAVLRLNKPSKQKPVATADGAPQAFLRLWLRWHSPHQCCRRGPQQHAAANGNSAGLLKAGVVSRH